MVALFLASRRAFALTEPNLPDLIPADKKLASEWIASLVARGKPTVFRGEELRFVGMPVNGIGTGQLYLGGDGRLWHWDLFNRSVPTGSEHYEHPLEPTASLEQGFALQIGDRVYPLDRSGFADVSFRGEYPIGRVEYRDPAVAVTVTLESFSPFAPLALEDSSLPVTVMEFSLHNPTGRVIELMLVGKLENGILRDSPWAAAQRRNRAVEGPSFTFIECSAESGEAAAPVESAFANVALPGDEWIGIGHVVTSREFTLTQPYINLRFGRGPASGRTTVRLFVEGKPVRNAEVRADAVPRSDTFDVRNFTGKTARLEIEWPINTPRAGGVESITRSDRPATAEALTELPDFGSMGLALLGTPADQKSADSVGPLHVKLMGNLGRAVRLAPGASATVTFVLAWSFPNLRFRRLGAVGRHCAERFPTALAAVRHVAEHYSRLADQTRLWRGTWYDSTLPFWLLDRTMANTAVLATSTSHRFANGRFWGWEGVVSGPGTCTHVWGYAQAPARLFPDLERDLRERTDYGIALRPDGCVLFRGEFPNAEDSDGWAVDGQAMVLLRTWREHQISVDDGFLRRVWPAAKRALEALIARDPDRDGLLDGPQHNTLDSAWYGHVAWLSGLYAAALRAGEEMALEMDDPAFAATCRELAARASRNIVRDLFDGEYFVNRVDASRPETINSGTGCHIDQVLGQSWAWQVGLGRILPKHETCQALEALWRYNFAPDVGPYRAVNRAGRWFAMPGEAGLLMTTFPRPGWKYEQAKGDNRKTVFAGYFNECMTGCEYQVAGHMVWEGMAQEGLAVARAVHDRYAASRRNPWNEVEFGDHYARSMASYGVFLAVCGFEYHGPKGFIGFAPRLTPENFRAPFTTAEGWGTYSQRAEHGAFNAQLALKWGRLRLTRIRLRPPFVPSRVAIATMHGHVGAKLEIGFVESGVQVVLTEPVILLSGQTLDIQFS